MPREDDCSMINSDRIIRESSRDIWWRPSDPAPRLREQQQFFQGCITNAPPVPPPKPVGVRVVPSRPSADSSSKSWLQQQQAEAAILGQERREHAQLTTTERGQEALTRAEEKKRREQAEAEKTP